MKNNKKILKPLTREFIFGDDRPFLSCHASTLVKLDNDDILVAWFGGTAEKNPDTAIWFSRKTDGEWSYPKVLVDKSGIAMWNPVLFKDQDERIILFYKVGEEVHTWHTEYITSYDLGETWSEPQELIRGDTGGRGPSKNKPIILHDGTWVAPGSIETEITWNSFVDISYDKGKTWIRSENVPIDCDEFKGQGIIQPTIWESEPNKIHMLLRSSYGSICRSDSSDGGKTWSQLYRTSLPNNNSGIDVVKLDDGTLALAYNPISENWGPRNILAIALSVDNGETWPYIHIIEENEGEYSYPSIIASGNTLHMVYTWKRERIVYLSCPVDHVKKNSVGS
jgi:predicted neuraminidase